MEKELNSADSHLEKINKSADSHLERIIKALWKEIKALWKKSNESAMKIWKRFWKYTSALKLSKCPEIITGANFHFETVELCILNNYYALCILFRKIPSSDDFANILELLYTL